MDQLFDSLIISVILDRRSCSWSSIKNTFYLKTSSIGNLLWPSKFRLFYLVWQLRYERKIKFQKEFIYNRFLGIHWRQYFNFVYTRHLQSAARNRKETRSPLLVGNLNLKSNEEKHVYIKSCRKNVGKTLSVHIQKVEKQISTKDRKFKPGNLEKQKRELFFVLKLFKFVEYSR